VHLIARRPRLGKAGIELCVLPAHCHQLLIHLLRLGLRLLGRLGQLGLAGLGRLLGRFQLCAFGSHGGNLGLQLLILFLQRGDRLGGPG
jgi:hypothetical protein